MKANKSALISWSGDKDSDEALLLPFVGNMDATKLARFSIDSSFRAVIICAAGPYGELEFVYKSPVSAGKSRSWSVGGVAVEDETEFYYYSAHMISESFESE